MTIRPICTLIAMAIALISPSIAASTSPMFDPVIDRPDEEWCYAAQSTTVIGLPFVPEPVQVTYDGAIYTRLAELCFFYGNPLQPVMARNKTFLNGWIPVVQYGWKHGGVEYHLEIFSAELPQLGRKNLVQFVKMTMHNPGKTPVPGAVAAAVRGSGETFRSGRLRAPVTPATRFILENNRLMRDGKLLYLFSPGAKTLAVPDTPHRGVYIAGDFGVTSRVATGFAVYRRTLQPGESFEAIFKMPRVPLTNAKEIAAVEAAEYRKEFDKTAAYWKNLFGDFGFEIPEKRVNDSYRASLVHLMLATRAKDDGTGKRQGSGLPYDALFLNDYIDMIQAYDTAGLCRFVEPNIDWLLMKQHPSGMFIDVHNRGNNDIVTSHGQGLFELAHYLVMTRDEEYGKKVYPAIRKGVEFIIRDHRTNNKYGLIRASIPYDAPMLTGHFTCHNERHPAEPLSFDLVRRAFLKEYERRFEQYKADGNKPYPVEPPKLLTPEERKALFQTIFAPSVCGIAVGKPVSASKSLPGHSPALAVDGRTDQPAISWQTDPYPAWLKIDLEEPATIDRIRVFPFWGGGRYYRYTIDVSADDKTWKQVVDRSKNTEPATPKGHEHRFDPVSVRYIRVNMLHHNLNHGVHLVEVQAFAVE